MKRAPDSRTMHATMRRWLSHTALYLLLTALLIGAQATHPTRAQDAAPQKLAPSRFIEVDGVRLHYTSNATAADALTLVLLHGFGASVQSWFDVHPALAAKFPVVRLDLLGHGFSDKPRDADYSPQNHARLVLRFIETLGLKRVVLVGHSMGGGVSLLIALAPARPFEVAGLVLIASSGYPQKLPFFVENLRDPVRRFIAGLIPAEQRTRYVLERIFFDKTRLTPERLQRYAHFAALPGHHQAMANTALQILPPNIEQVSAQIRDVNVPSLILWGDQDRVVPLENAYRFNRDIKHSTLRIVPQAGHMLPEERPAQVVENIVAFTAGL